MEITAFVALKTTRRADQKSPAGVGSDSLSAAAFLIRDNKWELSLIF